MRKITLAALALPLLTATASFAESPDSGRYLSDPAFLPKAGQIEGRTELIQSNSSYDLIDTNGTKSDIIKGEGLMLRQMVGYGVTDRFTLRLTDDYALETQYDNQLTSTQDKTKSSGLHDPKISAAYRLIPQGKNPYNLDLSGFFKPTVFRAQEASTDKHGTVANGGATYGLGAAVSRVNKSFTLRGSMDVVRYEQATSKHLSDGSTTTTGGRTALDLGLQGQWRFLRRMSLDADLGYEMSTSNKIGNNGSTPWGATQDNGDIFKGSLGLAYDFIPERLIGGLYYEYTQADKTGYSDLNNFSVSKMTNQREDAYIFRLHYLFR